MAAPCATSVMGSSPSPNRTPSASRTRARRAGITVGPPTRTMRPSWLDVRPCAVSRRRQTSMERSMRGTQRSSSVLCWMTRSTSIDLPSTSKAPGSASEVSGARVSSILASSTASLSLRTAVAWRASARLTVTPWVRASSSSTQSTSAQSKSRPPRKLSPSWPTTRSRPSRVSSSETSNVPPPRS